MKVRRRTWGAAGALLAITVLYYWKIILTRQFSLLTGYEGANQAYAWLSFLVRSIRHGGYPLWDPYVFCGRVFAGEMQAGEFYPFYLPLALFPLRQPGVLIPSLYHAWFALSHFLAAWFMFLLIRELKLGAFPAMLGGLAFSLGGVLARLPDWPHLLNSGIWLPLIFLFLLRALKTSGPRLLANASACGLCLGLSILAGGLHMAMMQALVIVTAAIYDGFTGGRWRRNAAVVAVTAAVAFAAGAVQLLPSIEYSQHAFRFVNAGPVPGGERIPYSYLTNRFYANGILSFLFAVPRSDAGIGETLSPYIGVFPLLLAALGIWKDRKFPFVRYFTGLAGAAFIYTLGPASLLHGVLYAVVPYLWLAHEADRFMYLADFALAVLAAYGANALFSAENVAWASLSKVLQWIALAAMAALVVPALYGSPALSPWTALSLVLIIASWLLFRYVATGNTGSYARVLTIALMLFDLAAFDFTAANRAEMSAKGADEMERLMSCEKAVRFLKSQPGLFRVQLAASPVPNIGDTFEIQAFGGSGVTLAKSYADADGHPDLMNVKYFIKPAATPDAGAIYQDREWKVYENPNAFPRAWLVHAVEIERSPLALLSRLNDSKTDLRRVALLPAPLDAPLDSESLKEEVTVNRYQANEVDLTVQTGGRALLLLSELPYPGWTASVNGKPAEIRIVDGFLRGIPVPRGESHVLLRYRPQSIYAGSALTVAAFCLVPLFFLAVALRARKEDRQP